jgi:O-antigen ligase
MNEFPGNYNRNHYGSFIGHNTGAASMGMGPFFFALGGVFFLKNRWAKGLMVAYSLVAVWFFIVTQSRAVWILVLLLTPVFLFSQRAVGVRFIRWRHILIGLLVFCAFVFTQVLPWRLNFLKLESRDYQSRLHGLKPAVVIEGTRARILVVTQVLIVERPFFGHGINSFSVLYPHAQARYFAANPDTMLRPTLFQTMHAHNDYLQLVIETGYAGLVLGLVVAFLFYRRGRRRFDQLEDPEERVRRFCAFFAVVGILLHSFVDFPFHIAPLATFFLVYAAMAHGSGGEDVPRSESAARIPHPARPLWRTIAASLVVLAYLAALCVPMVSPFVYTWNRVKADRLLTTGVRIYLRATREADPAQELPDLRLAREYIRQSLRLRPLDSYARLYLAMTDHQTANLFTRRALNAKSQGIEEIGQALELQAASYAQSSIEEARRFTAMADGGLERIPIPQNDSHAGPRLNDRVAEILSRAWRLVYFLDPNHPDALRNSFENLKIAVYYSPADVESAFDLLDFMQRHRLGNPEDIPRMLRNLARFVPEELQNHLLLQQAKWEYQDQGARAVLLFTQIQKVAPDPWLFPAMSLKLAWLHVHSAPNPDALAAQIGHIERHWPNEPMLPVLRMFLTAMRGDHTAALRTMRGFVEANAAPDPSTEILLSEFERLAGDRTKADALFNRALARMAQPGNGHAYRALVRRTLNDPGWVADAESSLLDPGASDHLSLNLFALLRHYGDQGDGVKFQEALETARLRMPGNTGIDAIERKYAPRADE